VSIGQGIALAGLAWLLVGGGALVLAVLRLRTLRAVVAELHALHDVGNGYGHDLLQEAESLREVVEPIREDERLGQVLDEVCAVHGAIERRPS
jgi:hypothetical protein